MRCFKKDTKPETCNISVVRIFILKKPIQESDKKKNKNKNKN